VNIVTFRPTYLGYLDKKAIGKDCHKKATKKLFEFPKNLSGYCLRILEASFGLYKLRKDLN
jgi:hypothetical protein